MYVREVSVENQKLLELEYLSKKYDETNIPLYLSYPTTSWWKEHTDDETFVRSFEKENNPFLYFHFPYCKKPCYYCCCYKEVTRDERKKEAYIRYLEKEFLRKCSALKAGRFRRIKHMHWGGGTPTYAGCRQIERIFSVIAKHISLDDASDSGISIEAYPDDEILDSEKLKLIRRLGFNEISFGVQDFDNRIQKAINRDCDVETVTRIVNQAKELGFRVHIDLCYGLPFQGLHELEKTILHIVTMNPERIALFPYAHYPLLFPLQRLIPFSSLPNSFMKVLLIRQAEELLSASGYKKIGIDHFVRPENPLYKASVEKKIIKDFMGYSVDSRRCCIGFGSSAISFSGTRYFHNTIRLKEYYRRLDRHLFPLNHDMSFYLSGDETIRNMVIQKSILCDFVIDKEEIGRVFSIDFDDYFSDELVMLKEYEKDRLIRSSKEKIIVTPIGKYFSRHIAHVFDNFYRRHNHTNGTIHTYKQIKLRRHSI
jgi:oxygen-independent coproporphyrinogen-3 oxidase